MEKTQDLKFGADMRPLTLQNFCDQFANPLSLTSQVLLELQQAGQLAPVSRHAPREGAQYSIEQPGGRCKNLYLELTFYPTALSAF